MENKKKKVVRKKKDDLKQMSTEDLYALYLFVIEDFNRGFSSISPEAKKIIANRKDELKEELYRRAYGFNPHKKFPATVVEGIKPENIDLNRFVVYKEKKEEE